MPETETKCPDCGAEVHHSGPENWTACGRFFRGGTWTGITRDCYHRQLFARDAAIKARDETIKRLKEAMPPAEMLRGMACWLGVQSGSDAPVACQMRGQLVAWADAIEAVGKG